MSRHAGPAPAAMPAGPKKPSATRGPWSAVAGRRHPGGGHSRRHARGGPGHLRAHRRVRHPGKALPAQGIARAFAPAREPPLRLAAPGSTVTLRNPRRDTYFPLLTDVEADGRTSPPRSSNAGWPNPTRAAARSGEVPGMACSFSSPPVTPSPATSPPAPSTQKAPPKRGLLHSCLGEFKRTPANISNCARQYYRFPARKTSPPRRAHTPAYVTGVAGAVWRSRKRKDNARQGLLIN